MEASDSPQAPSCWACTEQILVRGPSAAFDKTQSMPRVAVCEVFTSSSMQMLAFCKGAPCLITTDRMWSAQVQPHIPAGHRGSCLGLPITDHMQLGQVIWHLSSGPQDFIYMLAGIVLLALSLQSHMPSSILNFPE